MNFVQEHIIHPHQSFRVLRLELDAFRGARHRHRQLELTWIEQGRGLRFVGDSVEPFDAGDLVLLGPDLPHAWTSSRRRAGQPHVCTVLQFAPDMLEPGPWPELAEARGLAALAARGVRIGEPGRGAITRALQRLSSCSPGLSALAAWFEVLALLLQHQAAMVPLASAAMRSATALRSQQDSRVAQVIDWIRRHLARELTVEAAARLVHVSPAAFSRYFRREVGKSFTRYVNDMRCSEACLRLRGSNKAVAVIAHECGFATLSNFNRQFRLRTGLTPRDFRLEG